MTGGVAPAATPLPEAATASDWTGGRTVSVVIGGLLTLFAVVLLGAGGVGFWAETQREDGYITTDTRQYSTSGSALVTKEANLGSAGVGWLYPTALLGKIRVRVTPGASASPLFVGIGPSDEVDKYLGGTSRTVIAGSFGDKTEFVGGGPARSAPGTQHFWVASTTGPRGRSLYWKPADGTWTVVVMRADGRPGVAARADLGARISALPWVATGLTVAGLVFVAGGVLLIVGAVRRRPSSTT
jgi:hypothetical protein